MTSRKWTFPEAGVSLQVGVVPAERGNCPFNAALFNIYIEIPDCIFKMLCRDSPVDSRRYLDDPSASWPSVCRQNRCTIYKRVLSCSTFNINLSPIIVFLIISLMSFFLSSFGKRSAGSLRRGCECIVLEPSEMIVVSPIVQTFSTRASKSSQYNIQKSE